MGKWAHLCLNGAFKPSQGPYIATAEPGNCRRESFYLPLMGHSFNKREDTK